MAFTGLAKPFVAKLTEVKDEAGLITNETYSDGFLCGKAVSISVNPEYAEGNLYGDNALAEFDREFSSAEVTMETTYLPEKARTIMLGHKKNDDVIEYGINDSAEFVGLGFYTTERVDGVKSYVAIFLPKVKFVESEESFETKNDSMNYITPSLSGSATGNKDNCWKYVKTFPEGPTHDGEKNAIAWLKEKMGIAD